MVTGIPDPMPELVVRFWGVRGSICSSGPQFVEFGGHTPCIEIRCSGRRYIIDAGTGLSALGAAIAHQPPDESELLLSHLHLDHVEGLPFFKPVLFGDRLLRVYCGNLGGETAEQPLDRLFSPPLFPIRLKDLPGQVEHVGFRAGETLTLSGGQIVRTHPLNHPNGATGYRFDHAGRSVCYICDNEHTDPWPDPALAGFIAKADLVIYDGMFSEGEYTRCKGWGHSTWQKGVELCLAAGVAALAIIHLHPQHNDSHLRAVEAEMKAVMPSAFVAREGQSVTLTAVA